MQQLEVIKILKKNLNFDENSIEKLKDFINLVLKENKNHNLIAKSTENHIWLRQILDSAQLVKFIDFSCNSLADLGAGAGFPGLVVEIFNQNKAFHVKLFEKSPVIRQFLLRVIKELGLNAEVRGDIRDEKLSGLSNEIKSKLLQVKPKTLGQAIRIDGVTPAAIIILLSHIKKLRYKATA